MTTSERPPGTSAERFRVCFQMHWAAAHNYLRSRGAGADCDDLASEVFATAWRRWPDVPEDQLPWLLRTARNHLASHRRTRQRVAGIALRAISSGQDRGAAVLFLKADGGELGCAGARACSYIGGEPNAGKPLPRIGASE
jgi:DNA-directed RNA polymerase specialized sigma24 family protein